MSQPRCAQYFYYLAFREIHSLHSYRPDWLIMENLANGRTILPDAGHALSRYPWRVDHAEL
jgi:hypothetical protein